MISLLEQVSRRCHVHKLNSRFTDRLLLRLQKCWYSTWCDDLPGSSREATGSHPHCLRWLMSVQLTAFAINGNRWQVRGRLLEGPRRGSAEHADFNARLAVEGVNRGEYRPRDRLADQCHWSSFPPCRHICVRVSPHPFRYHATSPSHQEEKSALGGDRGEGWARDSPLKYENNNISILQ